jgi:UDP-glucose 4-epimerase
VRSLVTGGAGFIGSHVVRMLVQEGWQVRVLDNFSTGYRRNLTGLPVELVEGDVRHASVVDRAMDGIEVVFHMAASVGNGRSMVDPVLDGDVNALATTKVLQSAVKNGVARFVYSSSAAVFGELQSPIVAEDHPLNPMTPYGVSKLAGEKYTLCYGHLYGLVAVCLRYFNVYGVNQRYDAYGNVIPIFAHRLHSGAPLTIYGDGEQTRDFVNVRDVARANYLAATRAHGGGVYNVGCGHSITINTLAQIVQEVSGIRACVEYAPPRDGEVRHCRADTRRLRTELEFTPARDIRAGLIEYFQWFCDEYNSLVND